MSQRLPAVTGRQLAKVLERKGWELDHVQGSHHVYANPELRRSVPIPVHAGRMIGRGLLSRILRQTDISRDEFLRLVRR